MTSPRLDILIASIFLAVGAALLASTFVGQTEPIFFEGDIDSYFVPRVFLTLWIIAALYVLAECTEGEALDTTEFNRPVQLVLAVIVVGLTAIGMAHVGFVFSTIPGFMAYCWVIGYRNAKQVTVLGISVPIFVWALFTHFLELLLPSSPWFHQI